MKLKLLLIMLIALTALSTTLVVLMARGDLELPWLGDSPEYATPEVIAIVRNKVVQECGAESELAFSTDRFGANYEGSGAWQVWHKTSEQQSRGETLQGETLPPMETVTTRRWKFYEKSNIVDPLQIYMRPSFNPNNPFFRPQPCP